MLGTMVVMLLGVTMVLSTLRRDAVCPRSDGAQIESWHIEMREAWLALSAAVQEANQWARGPMAYAELWYSANMDRYGTPASESGS